MTERRTFMGIAIEGDTAPPLPPRVPQRPVEDLRPYFEKLWEQGVKAVTWHQYTPHWNDGDTCEFTVYTPAFTKNPEVAKAWLQEDYNEWIEVPVENAEDGGKLFDRKRLETSQYDYELPRSEQFPHPDGIKKGEIDLPIESYEFEYAMKNTFGDHTEVVVTPERVIQWEYEHD